MCATSQKPALRAPHPVYADHVREAFPEYEVEFVNKSKSGELQRPFRITFPPFKQPEEQEQPAKVRPEPMRARS